MQPAANILIAQSHQQDLRRAAANGALRAEARRSAVDGLNPRRGRQLVVAPSPVRRLVARLAV